MFGLEPALVPVAMLPATTRKPVVAGSIATGTPTEMRKGTPRWGALLKNIVLSDGRYFVNSTSNCTA